MRVTCIINNQLPGDGVGNSIVELCRLLRSLGADLHVLHEKLVEPPDDLQGLFTRVTFEQMAAGRGPAAIEHWRESDLVLYDYSTWYPLVGAIALPHRGVRVFIHHGVTPPHLWLRAFGRADVCRGVENLKLARHADLAVAASPFTCAELQAVGVPPERIALLPYAVHPDRFSPGPRDETLQEMWGLQGHFVLLYTGRMASNKRIDTLVRGLAAARQSGLPIKLLLVGENTSEFYLPDVRQAEAVATELGVREHVVFTGRVSDEVLPHYFRLADLYVSASVHEGFGIPLVEAMACGKPIVAARAASVPWVVSDAGRFFEPDDAAGMGQAVAELLQSAVTPPPMPERPPRLCFIVPRYGLDFVGGAETLCRGWAETCSQAGWKVQVVTTTTTDMIDWSNHYSPGDQVLNGVPVQRFPVERRTLREHLLLHHRLNSGPESVTEADQRRWLETGIGRPALFDWLRDRREEFDFFVFMPYLFNTTLLGIEAVAEKAIVFPCLHDEGPAHASLVGRLLDSAHALFFNATAERNLARHRLRLANPNCFTLGMGMTFRQPGNGHAFRARYHVPGEYLLYCGRIEDGKNVPWLLDAYRYYRASASEPIELVLIGSGQAPHQEGVRALGFLPERDKLDAMAGAVALVNPSVNESFSIVLMESWLEGRPVLVHGGCAVTASHVRQCGGGLCFETAQEFAAAVAALRADPDQASQFGCRGQSYVREQYDWPSLLQRFRDCLDLLRSASAYEQLAVRALARSRQFDPEHYRERWEAFLDRAWNGRPHRSIASAHGPSASDGAPDGSSRWPFASLVGKGLAALSRIIHRKGAA